MMPLDLQSIQRLTRDMSDLEVREHLDSRELDQLLQKLEKADSETQLECLRGLRMSVAGVRKNAQYILDKLSLDTKLQDLVCLFLPGTGLSLRIYLQMLANCVHQEVIIQECLKESILEITRSIYSTSKDEKSSNVMSSILLSLMKKEDSLDKYIQFIDPWIHLVSGEEVEFSALCIKHIVLNHRLVELESLKRQALIPILIDLEILPELDIDSVSSIVQDFTFLTDKILTTNIGSVEDLVPEIILNLLDFIQSAAANTIHQTRLQGMQSLLLNTLYLLRMVHEAGKNGVEDFKPIGKLSELSELHKKTSESEDLESNPVFGFKVKLIQLLVNLVWENSENQTLVGELEGVQLLLDCSQIDGKNPLISQWVILSVKALCDKHPENQNILFNLRRQGAADSILLTELGLRLPAETSGF